MDERRDERDQAPEQGVVGPLTRRLRDLCAFLPAGLLQDIVRTSGRSVSTAQPGIRLKLRRLNRIEDRNCEYGHIVERSRLESAVCNHRGAPLKRSFLDSWTSIRIWTKKASTGLPRHETQALGLGSVACT